APTLPDPDGIRLRILVVPRTGHRKLRTTATGETRRTARSGATAAGAPCARHALDSRAEPVVPHRRRGERNPDGDTSVARPPGDHQRWPAIASRVAESAGCNRVEGRASTPSARLVDGLSLGDGA